MTDYGTIFTTTPAGNLQPLFKFNKTNGQDPVSTLAQGTDGNLYGTTYYGGTGGGGTVFKLTPGGMLGWIHNFAGTDGAHPSSGLIQATDGNFYGTTEYGGAHSRGTVFKITPAGTLTPGLFNFDGANGSQPLAPLVQGADGNLYGTTFRGGSRNAGTVFKMSPGGGLPQWVYSFGGTNNGVEPEAGLVQATDGNFYGTTYSGGVESNHFGTIFKIDSAGNPTILHSFGGTGSGIYPMAGLVQGTDGNFYGTTSAGGQNGYGTVFSLSVGLGPFIKTLPRSGKVRSAVFILGNNLTGATSISFNGTSATFTIVSGSEIKTSVPNGATTGKVQVKTPSRTLLSNVSFRVS